MKIPKSTIVRGQKYSFDSEYIGTENRGKAYAETAKIRAAGKKATVKIFGYYKSNFPKVASNFISHYVVYSHN